MWKDIILTTLTSISNNLIFNKFSYPEIVYDQKKTNREKWTDHVVHGCIYFHLRVLKIITADVAVCARTTFLAAEASHTHASFRLPVFNCPPVCWKSSWFYLLDNNETHTKMCGRAATQQSVVQCFCVK